jgi:hypothetical protein
MAKLRATPGKPTASTVETVDVLNGSKKDVGTTFLRRRSEPPSSKPEVEEPQEKPTRTSPRKRKEPPTAVAGPSKLRRVRTRDALVEGPLTISPTPQQRSSIQPVNAGGRQNVYDHPEANEEEHPAVTAPAPAPRKRKLLNRKGAVVTFEGVHEVGLPEASPAKGTRSHDKNRQVTISRRNDSKEALRAPSRKGPPNIMAQAAKEIVEGSNAETGQPEASPRSGRGRPRKVSNGHIPGRRGRPSEAADLRSSKPVVDPTTQYQATVDQPAANEEEAQDSVDESPSDTDPEPTSTSHKGTAESKLEAEVTAGVKDAVSLYGCETAWTNVLVYAKKAMQSSTSIKPKSMGDVLATIKGMRVFYQKISEDQLSDGELGEADEEVKDMIKNLKGLFVKIAADPKEHDLTFAEFILIRVIPRISRLMKAALAARFDKIDNSIAVDSLKELVDLTNIAIGFRDLVDKAEHKPEGLINDKGEFLMGLSRSAISGLKSIKAKYSRFVTIQEMVVEHAKEARLRQAEIVHEAERNAAIERQRTEEKAAGYARMLQEERERNAEAARKSQARRMEEERAWKQGLMSSSSVEAERLRKKFGLPYRPAIAVPAVSRVEDRVMDIDDFDVDEGFGTFQPRPSQPRRNGVNHSRPRPRREATEDIPAPVVEPRWTDAQTTALVWGLKEFRGQDRYQNVLHAPEVRDLLDGKSEFDLMQQALYIKQSMARALNTSPMLNGTPRKDDWSWLRSV